MPPWRAIAPTALATFLTCFAGLGVSATAQVIETEVGALHPDMTAFEVSRLLRQPVENLSIEGVVYTRRVMATFGTKTYVAFLTTKGVVYSTLSYEGWQRNPAGSKEAKSSFRDILTRYRPPPNAYVSPDGNVVGWIGSDGHPIQIALACNQTEVRVKITDYEQQYRDDGVRDDAPHEEFRTSFNGPEDCWF